MKSLFKPLSKLAPIALVGALGLSLACGGGSSSSTSASAITTAAGNGLAVMTLVAADYSSAQVSTVSDTLLKSQNTEGIYSKTDIVLTNYNKNFFVLGRYSADFLEKRASAAPSTALYLYDLKNSDETTVNPTSVSFVSETKAYVTRYGSNFQWVVNPSAANATEFFVKALDLSAYDDGDGAEIGPSIYAQGKVFMAAQRLSNFAPASNKAYLSVFDPTTDTEINTGKADVADTNLKGIALPALNPTEMEYNSALNRILILCTGDLGYAGSAVYSGGIISVDPTTYEATLIVDDGTDTSSLYGGNFYGMAVSSATLAYVSIYKGFDLTTYATSIDLRTFNPSTGEVGAVIAGFESLDIRSLSIDLKGRLWVSSVKNGAGLVQILDPATNEVVESFTTALIPSDIVFVQP